MTAACLDSMAHLPPSEFPEHSRILLLAVRLERRMLHYFPFRPPPLAAECRVILALAADTLPSPDAPTDADLATAAYLRHALSLT